MELIIENAIQKHTSDWEMPKWENIWQLNHNLILSIWMTSELFNKFQFSVCQAEALCSSGLVFKGTYIAWQRQCISSLAEHNCHRLTPWISLLPSHISLVRLSQPPYIRPVIKILSNTPFRDPQQQNSYVSHKTPMKYWYCSWYVLLRP